MRFCQHNYVFSALGLWSIFSFLIKKNLVLGITPHQSSRWFIRSGNKGQHSSPHVALFTVAALWQIMRRPCQNHANNIIIVSKTGNASIARYIGLRCLSKETCLRATILQIIGAQTLKLNGLRCCSNLVFGILRFLTKMAMRNLIVISFCDIFSILHYMNIYIETSVNFDFTLKRRKQRGQKRAIFA